MYKSNDKVGQLKLAIALELLPGLAPIENLDYRLIVADPPWQYELRETDSTHRGRCPYPNMDIDAILNLPIGAIAAKDAYLLLWVTNNHLPVGFQCLERWGFSYKAIYTWVKVTNASTEDNPKVNMGVGHYARNCTEHFLVATKGNPGAFTAHGLTNIPNVIFAPRTRHSQKPEEFWAIANRLAGVINGPKIELFARDRRDGWDVWGAEI